MQILSASSSQMGADRGAPGAGGIQVKPQFIPAPASSEERKTENVFSLQDNLGEKKQLSKMFPDQVWLFFFFSENAKLEFILKTSLLRKTIDLEMQNLIVIFYGISEYWKYYFLTLKKLCFFKK